MLGNLISAGASLAGGLIQSNAASKARKAQVEAEKRAQERYARAIAEIDRVQAPFLAAGQTGMDALTRRLGLSEEPIGNALRAGSTTPGTYGNTADPSWSPPSAAPRYERPGAFDYGLDDYVASPAYQWQQDQARKAILASASATGALQSGAALKELQDRAQQIAYQDFARERDFALGLHRDERDFDYGLYRDARAVYQDDRDFDRGVYQNDRDYLTNRFDRGTNDLFNYTNIGQNAAGLVSQAQLEAAALGAGADRQIGQAYSQNALRQGEIWGGLASDLGGRLGGYLDSRTITPLPEPATIYDGAPQRWAPWAPQLVNTLGSTWGS